MTLTQIDHQLDQIYAEIDRDLSIGEKIQVEEYLLKGESVDTCLQYLRGEL